MLKFTELFSNPFFQTAFSIVTFLLSNMFAYWLYKKSIGKKQIWWDSYYLKMTHPYMHKLKQVKVVYKEKVLSDIFVFRFVMWNSGSEVIKQEDISKKSPLVLTPGKDAQFLSSEVLSSSNNSVITHLSEIENKIAIDFEYLEVNQGLVLEIVYTGLLKDLKLLGNIKGGIIRLKNTRSEFMNRFPFINRFSYAIQRKVLIYFTSIAGLFMFILFSPLVIAAYYDRTLLDNGFWIIVPRIGVAAILYFTIMISLWKTPRMPNELEIFHQDFLDTGKENTNLESKVFWFREDFQGSILDPQKWIVIRGDGDLNVNDQLQLNDSKPSKIFHYIRSKGAIIPPTGDFILEIYFRYTQVEGNGTGIVLTNDAPEWRINLAQAYTKPWNFRIWQDTSGLRTGINGRDIILGKNDQNTHIVQLRWKDDTISVYLDDVFKGSEPLQTSIPRPTTLWMGNQVQLDHQGPWSGFIVKLIEVTKG